MTAALVTTDQQVVICQLAQTSYAITIATVQEIIRMQPLTPLPEAPPFVVGLINLRSSVVPVLDLRRRCGLPVGEQEAATRIVVVQQDQQYVGLIVDAVTQVTTIPATAIEPTAALVAADQEQHLLTGVARLEDQLVLLLDLGRVVRGVVGGLPAEEAVA